MNDLRDQLESIMPAALTGSVVRTLGTTVAVAGFPAPIGATVEISKQTGAAIRAEVVGFRDELTLIYPLGDITGVRRGNRVRLLRTSRFVRVGPELLGRVINAHGQCIDGRPQPALSQRVAIDRPAPAPVERPRIDTPLATGIRAIDGLLTCGKGQRMGVFSGSGVGKSVTLGMMARYTNADVNVIGLIGERGREVNEFIERDLGPEGLARSVVVVATSDEPALLRVRAASVATAVAEYFRDRKNDILLLMDSITRFAMAQREIGLAAGEPPATKGYTPSVFAMLPKLLERAGRTPLGSITGFYAVLVEGDDHNEPIADAVRGILDGHTVLSRDLASKGHYPAVDVLESISRLAGEITTPEQRQAVTVLRELLSSYRHHEDMISIGAYRKGSNPKVDLAIDMLDPINAFLRQTIDQSSSVETARQQLTELVQACINRQAANQAAAQTPAAATAAN